MPAMPLRPAIEEILTTEPPPESAMIGTPCFIPRNVPSTFTAMIRRKSSSDIEKVSVTIEVPAQLTMIVSLSSWTIAGASARSEEHTSELQSLMRISYAVFCLKQKKTKCTNEKHK